MKCIKRFTSLLIYTARGSSADIPVALDRSTHTYAVNHEGLRKVRHR